VICTDIAENKAVSSTDALTKTTSRKAELRMHSLEFFHSYAVKRTHHTVFLLAHFGLKNKKKVQAE
jgi:hypothetical protein